MTLTQINKAGLDEIALDHVFTIGASGSSAYTFQGEGLNGTVNNPTLYLTRGKTYRFENGSGGHPIRIQSTPGASGTAYNTGVTNNSGSGTVIVEVQHDAPDVLYYQCTSHAAMNGILYITGALADGGVTTAKLADDAVTDAKLANSINSAIAANTAKNTNATHTGDVTGSTSLTIACGAVTTAKLADDAVTGAKIADSTITAAHLAINSVGGQEIQANAVGTSELVDGNVTAAKLASGVQTTINNNAENRLITGSGTANTLEAEPNILLSTSSTDNVFTTNSNSSRLRLFGGTNASVSNGGTLSLQGVSHSSGNYTDLSAGAGGHIQFRTGTSERMRLTSSGQLLLGDTSTFDSNTAIQFRKDNAGGTSDFIFRNRGNNSSSRVQLKLTTLNRAANADVHSGIEKYQSGGMAIYNGENTNQYSGISFFCNGWSSLRLKNGNQSGHDVAHIAAYFGISNGLLMEVGGPQSGTHKAIRFTTSHTGTERGYIGVNYGGTSYNNTSDYRLKQNIVSLTDATSRLKNLLPKRFQWKEDPTYTVDGFLAHEAVTVVPESVTGEKDAVDSDGKPIYQVIDQSKLIPLLTAALQEAVAKIETLETKVAALEAA